MRRALLSVLASLATLPLGWPHHLLLGVTDSPGDAHHLREVAHVDARSQYLSGGVNTGHGWSTWNPSGTRTRVVLWQLPLGDTRLNDTWGHYRDNRLQWWLDDASGAHLRATRSAGVVGLLFGGGATGTTSDQSDGGFFYRLARAYESHPLSLGGL
jgi:hypothetical protein